MANDSLKTDAATSAPRSRSTEEVRQDIARARAELADAASALKSEVAERIHWRTWVRENPAPILLGAFAISLWIGYRD